MSLLSYKVFPILALEFAYPPKMTKRKRQFYICHRYIDSDTSFKRCFGFSISIGNLV